MKEYANIHWLGDAKETLSAFPGDVKSVLGYSLRRLQKGLLPDCDARRMESVGKGVWELKTADERTWYRVIYLTRIGNSLYVLHAFEKDSRKTDRRDLEIAKARLKLVNAQLRTLRVIKMTRKTKATHVTRGDVLDDLGFSRSEATALKFKADLLDAIRGEIERRTYTQKELVSILDEHQPAVSNLIRGRINQVSIEKLLRYADRLGMRARLKVLPAVRAVTAA